MKKNTINVVELAMKLYLQTDIDYKDLQSKLIAFVDRSICKEKEFLAMHTDKKYTQYVFSGLFPLETDKVYKKGKVYTLTIRTINYRLAQYFAQKVVHERDDSFKALACEVRILPKKMIEKIYSLTPVILKNDAGYWKKALSVEEFERRLQENAIKKYEAFTGEKLEEFQLYTALEFTNRTPIAIHYKGIKLLGDKVTLQIAENETAQKVAYFLLGVGILENNSRGCGFLNYRWL